MSGGERPSPLGRRSGLVGAEGRLIRDHIARAEWKPLQLDIARQVGLATPLTLVGNDPADIAEFAKLVDGPVVCKTLSSMVLAEDGQHKITYTTLIDPGNIDHAAFASTAHLLQAWVPKAREVRATVVGERVLAVAIEADSAHARVDWRADYDALRYLPITVRMLAYLRALELNYGGFDFVITLWVPNRSSTSGDLGVFVDQPAEPVAASEVRVGRWCG